MKADAPGGPEPVKFRFEHVGPVAEAELDLGDLTIIAGRNNTGKTYLVYTLYGFLKTWKNWSGPSPAAPEQAEARPGATDRYSTFEKITRSIRKGGEARITVERRMLGQERNKVMESLTRHSRKMYWPVCSALTPTRSPTPLSRWSWTTRVQNTSPPSEL